MKLVQREVYYFSNSEQAKEAFHVARAKGAVTATINSDDHCELTMSYKDSCRPVEGEYDNLNDLIIRTWKMDGSSGVGIFELDGNRIKYTSNVCCKCEAAGNDTIYAHDKEDVIVICIECLQNYKVRLYEVKEDDHVTIKAGGAE